jgi:signal transduction histidine kinase/DNA-binding response OmpR family regulator
MSKNISSLLLILFFAINVLGQDISKPNKFHKDSVLITKLFDRALVERDKSDSLLSEAILIVDNNDVEWTKLKTIFLYNKAKYEYLLQKFDASLSTCTEGLDLLINADPYNQQNANFCSLIGNIKALRNEPLEGIFFLRRAIFISDHNQLETKSGLLKNNIANIYLTLRDYESAYKYSSEAYDMLKKYDDPGLRTIAGVKALAALKIGKEEEARELGEESVLRSTESNYPMGLILGHIVLGEYFLLKENYQKSLEHLLLSLELSEIYGQKNFIMLTKISLLSCYNQLKQFDTAIMYGEEALVETREQGNESTEYAILKNLSECYAGVNNTVKAYDYLAQSHNLFSAVNDIENKEIINELLIEYQTEVKEQEIILLKSEKELTKQRRKSQYYLLIGAISILIIIVFFLFLLSRNRKKTGDKLVELDKVKTTFFENISHEFRTPLTLIRLPIKDAIDNETALSKEHKMVIYDNTKRLQYLIDDLLIMAQLESNEMTQDHTVQNPIDQIENLFSQFEFYAVRKNIHYSKEIVSFSHLAKYDGKVVDKVFSNLVTNALKFCPENGEVKVVAEVVKNELILLVSDSGIGLSKADQVKVFDRFYQVEGSGNNEVGTGIGLSLTKKLLLLNNGRISVESTEGRGSTFTAVLPLEISKELETTKIENNELTEPYVLPEIASNESDFLIENNDKPVLLIVEDNINLQRYLQKALSDEFRIHTAINGAEGLKKALEEVPDIIVSDWMMPEMSGIEFCKEVKSNKITSHIPFILLTAKSEVKDKIEGYETGADTYFSKPFDQSEVKAQIKNLIKQRKKLIEKFSSGDFELLKNDKSISPHDIEFLNKFRTYIQEHLSETDLSSQTIAEALLMSRMQLHRKIKALTDSTVGEYIHKQRMTLASVLLRKGDMRIAEICEEIGFSNPSAFSRAFKKEFDLSPSNFKLKHKTE